MHLFALGVIRELLGAGSVFWVSLFGAAFEPWSVMRLPPAGFVTLGVLTAAPGDADCRRSGALATRLPGAASP